MKKLISYAIYFLFACWCWGLCLHFSNVSGQQVGQGSVLVDSTVLEFPHYPWLERVDNTKVRAKEGFMDLSRHERDSILNAFEK